MAYGQFTGYEPLPDIPGAYNFQTSGGKALTFGGPEADQLKARIDAANATTLMAYSIADGRDLIRRRDIELEHLGRRWQLAGGALGQ